MIARLWQSSATPENVLNYREHFRSSVLPHVEKLPGFRGCLLLEELADGESGIMALTLWESLDSVKAFSGENISSAVVEEAAAAVLSRYNLTVDHFNVAVTRMPDSQAEG